MPAALGEPPFDLFELTATLVDIPSVSHGEAAIADYCEQRLRAVPGLEVVRIGDNVCARTSTGASERLMLAGHLDTVPPNGNERARPEEGSVLWGLGSADMKGGLAVMLALAAQSGGGSAGSATSGDARGVPGAGPDLTFIFYVCEEVDQRHSGLREIERTAPEWLSADAAVLGEPTASVVEAGCQGVLRVGVTLRGARAHTARPWMGVNAIHRLSGVLEAIATFPVREPLIDGCTYREALQAVAVSGGVANNVVPDEARVVVNHRFAPDRTVEEAFDSVRALLSPTLDLETGDSIELEDSALPAAPGLRHALLSSLVLASATEPKAKLGWTDVSFFAARGMPAVNFGPGEPTLAHSAGERVTDADLRRAYSTLSATIWSS